MSVEFLDGTTILGFLDDEKAFNGTAEGLYAGNNRGGTMGLEEYKTEIRKMMVAVATGLGPLPAQMLLEEDSFLKKAVDWEVAKLAGAAA